jgi:hypothetical protein
MKGVSDVKLSAMKSLPLISKTGTHRGQERETNQRRRERDRDRNKSRKKRKR